MILTVCIRDFDLKYMEDIRECLIHNSSNRFFDRIVVFSEKDLGISYNSKKISVMRMNSSHFDAISYSLKHSRCYVVYSSPLIKFGDMSSLRDRMDAGDILRCHDSYYAFGKKTKIKNRADIDDILQGPFKEASLHSDRRGYYSVPGFPVASAGWKISGKRIDMLEMPAPVRVQEAEKPKPASPPSLPAGRERRIDVVIVSVDYSDLLDITLPRNRKIFDRITVVTSTADDECARVCARHGARVVRTDCMYSGGASFNKGKAINEGIASLSDPDVLLLLDADIIVEQMPDLSSISDNTIYYRDRIMLRDYDAYERHMAGDLAADKESIGPVGYFQMFSYKGQKYPENSQDAAWSDVRFARKFRHSRRLETPVLHLGEDRKNWKGRKTARFAPKDSKKKDGSVTVLSYYFNFRNDIRQKQNFVEFLKQFEGRHEMLYVGLVDYGDLDFEVPCRKLVLRGDPDRKVWSKEMLVNRMIDSVETEYVAWIDGDIIYDSMDWLDDISSVAAAGDFVQLFEEIDYLDAGGSVLETRPSLASSGRDVDALLGRGAVPGGAWLGKASVLKQKRLFEKMLVGGGDTVFAYALYGSKERWTLGKVREASEEIFSSAQDWISSFGRYSSGFMPVRVRHLYHGDLCDRNYNGRYEMLDMDMFEREMVFAGMAALPSREKSLKICVDSLIGQVDRIGVYLNGWDRVPDFLVSDKIEVVRSQEFGDHGDAGKFYWIDGFEGYYFSCDDDIRYPDDYVSRTVSKIEEYGRKAVVGYHGSNILEGFRDYYDRSSRKVHMFSKELQEDTQVHILGTGTVGFHTSTIRVRFSDFEFPNMADSFLARLGQEQQVPFVVQKHGEGEMTSIESGFAISRSSMKKDMSFADTSERQNIIARSIQWKHHSFDSKGPKAGRLRILLVGRFDGFKKGGIYKSNHLMFDLLSKGGHEVFKIDSMQSEYSIPEGLDACVVYPGDPSRPDFEGAEKKMLEARDMGVPCCINLSYTGSEERSAEICRIFSRYNSGRGASVFLLSFTEAIKQDAILRDHAKYAISFPKTLSMAPRERIKRYEERSGILLGDIAKLEDGRIVASDAQQWIDAIAEAMPGVKIYAYKQYGKKTSLRGVELVDYKKAGDFEEFLSGIRISLTINQKATFEMLPIECQSLGVPVIYVDMPPSLNSWIGHTGICVSDPEEGAKMAEFLYTDRNAWNSYSRMGLLNYERCRVESAEAALDVAIRKMVFGNGR